MCFTGQQVLHQSGFESVGRSLLTTTPRAEFSTKISQHNTDEVADKFRLMLVRQSLFEAYYFCFCESKNANRLLKSSAGISSPQFSGMIEIGEMASSSTRFLSN